MEKCSYRLFVAVGLCVALGCSWSLSGQTRKVFEPGNVWTDTKGVPINAHGGGIIFQNGTYYWFGEHKTGGHDGNTAKVGVGCYSSNDLMNWKNEGIALSVVADVTSDIASGCVIERPKVIYNAPSKQFVMWFHLELKDKGYDSARTGLAVSQSVVGPYIYQGSVRPNAGQWPLGYAGKRLGQNELGNYEWWTPAFNAAVENGLMVERDFNHGQMSRDMTLFVDDDGRAYHIHSAEENLTLHISLLTNDYQGFTDKWVRVFSGGHNEAPAVFKRNGKYYMVMSGCTGWKPNAARVAVADSMLGQWTQLGNPCVGENSDKTFISQSTFVLPVAGLDDAYIFMADRWKPNNPIDGTYVWLPIKFNTGLPVIKWYESWDLSVFDH